MSFFRPLNKPANPALPPATPVYSTLYHDKFNSILRLFFNQIQNVFDNLVGPNGGQYIDCPHGVFYNTQDQVYAANVTAYAIQFDSTYMSNAIRLRLVAAGSFVVGVTYIIRTTGTTNFVAIGAANNNVGTVFTATGAGSGTGTAAATSQIEVLVSGVYNFQYTGQVYTSTGNKVEVALWVARNGTNVPRSTRINTIASNNHYFEILWDFNIDLAEGEWIELKTSIDAHAPNIKLDAFAAVAPYPSGASSVLTMNFVAPLPDPRPTLPP